MRRFYNALATTVAFGDVVFVRLVLYYGQQLIMHNWFCKADWYRQEAHFVVAKDDDQFGVTPRRVVDALGAPSRTLLCGELQVLVYDYDITPALEMDLSAVA